MYGGKKLRQLRQHLGLNQDEFATELKISQPYYSAIESGKKPITNKILDQLRVKWQIKKEYFAADNNKFASEIMGVENGGNIGGIDGGNRFLESIKKSLIKQSPRMEFVYKATEDLKSSNPELMELRYNVSSLAALLIDAENIYITYLQGAISDDIKADTYKEYKAKLTDHLSNFTKYSKAINPFISCLKAFILEFHNFDKSKVIEHTIDELNDIK
ncbi:helix-turn-helix domain-containing protein [Mucilaginibacter sp.]|uniref:helix-turn-helix domain-containing protein n=1 Tax=Mucilaginibacter sp. TaxID=1882438 RepID=UPI000CABC615|nr:helix-turn-helix transcriptional regulator [Mucilaginibacter sp.]PLW88751.1 MAG: hypothetical protein C0154_15210 [Mucilaginibacter sp.]PMP65702.1 MAG: hypothetical protein C0191_03040 [Mucilaginibacter sp.]HEK20677.1 XRE family transcriptional regulator [Bacteroidota bacterium]